MTPHITTHVTTVVKNSQAFRTIIPKSVVKKLNLQASDILEWIEGDGKNEVIIKNFGTREG